jgi:putative transposase
MIEVNRKVTYRLYPTRRQEAELLRVKEMHRQIYNAALEERIGAWKKTRKTISFVDQCRSLTQVRNENPEYKTLNAQSLQITLHRLHLGYQAFFRRIKRGEKPGFPRFKNKDRFHGFGYSSQTGWDIEPGINPKNVRDRNGKIRIEKMWVKIKGQTRNKGQYSSMEVVRRNGRWYAVATMQCWPVRGKGNVAVGIDLGLETLATVAYDTHDRKIEKINNPRFLKRQLQKLKAAQRVLAKKKRGSGRRGKAEKVVVRIHEKIANQRRDFIHQETAKIVGKVDLIATETLKVKNMVARGGARKRGLNRELHSASFASFTKTLKCKAEEAGVRWVDVPVKTVKPTQRCMDCDRVEKKPLSERVHRCGCGLTIGRDENSAGSMLVYALKETGREPAWRGGQELVAL